MSWMNRDEIEAALFQTPEDSNAERGARTLYRLMRWTDSHSDGWPYWQKPSRAATRLMEAIQRAQEAGRRGGGYVDITEAELKKAYTPIKAFLTRQGVERSEVFESWDDQ